MTTLLREPAPPAALPLWRTALLSFLPADRPWLGRVVAALPSCFIVVVQTVTTMRLNNIASSDEALYIDAGHAYLERWSQAPDYGAYFSGHPLAYPVFAALVDRVGGLELVRFASLLMMIGATFCVGSVARHLALWMDVRRPVAARWAAMLCFVLSGAVMFCGHLATYDAPCVLAVALALRWAVTGSRLTSAFAAGAALAVAAVLKYAGGGFLPVVVGLALVSSTSLFRNVLRSAVIGLSAVVLGVAVYWPSAGMIGEGLEFTTLSRQAHNYRDQGLLLWDLARGTGILVLLAVLGATLLVSRLRSARLAVLCLGLTAAAVAIPVSQLRMHEYTSFEKHLVFTALFLAPLAGLVVTLRRTEVRALVLVAGVHLLAVTALYRADFMFTEWPDSTPVFSRIQQEDRPGTYLAVGAQSMAYYSKDFPGLSWEEPWALFGAGRQEMRQAVRAGRYEGIVVVSGSSASAELDENVAYLTSLLEADPGYELVGTWAKHRYDPNRFALYLRPVLTCGSAGSGDGSGERPDPRRVASRVPCSG